MSKCQLCENIHVIDIKYVINENTIIPVEVKSDSSVTGKSLTLFNKRYQPPIRIRYSLKNLKQDEGLLNIPLFMADYTLKMIDKALLDTH